MKNLHKRPTEETWENGKLGASEEYTRKVSPTIEKAVDDALGLQIVSIRLQKKLIETFKEIAKIEGIGYQPLMRQVLTRYAHETLKVHKNQKMQSG